MSLFREEAVQEKLQALSSEHYVHCPVPYRLAGYAAVAFTALVIAFLFWGSYAKKSTVTGYVATTEGDLRIFPEVTGRIGRILVKEGTMVRKGDELFVVTMEGNAADGQMLGKAVLETLREKRETLSSLIDQTRELGTIAIENKHLELRALEEKIRGIEEERRIAKAQYDLARREHQRTQKAIRKGVMVKADDSKTHSQLLAKEAQLADIDRRKEEAETGIEMLKVAIRQVRAELEQKITQLRLQRADIDERILQAKGQRSRVVTAPDAGIISSLVIRVGQQVDPKQVAMTLLPSEAKFYVELLVPSRVIGFVREGADVNIRYDAFPFQVFGFHHAKVERISTAITLPGDIEAPVQLKEPFYRVRARLLDTEIRSGGREYALRSGMTLNADVLRERRRIIEWLFEPIIKAAKRI